MLSNPGVVVDGSLSDTTINRTIAVFSGFGYGRYRARTCDPLRVKSAGTAAHGRN
jgi:hypothetical protein